LGGEEAVTQQRMRRIQFFYPSRASTIHPSPQQSVSKPFSWQMQIFIIEQPELELFFARSPGIGKRVALCLLKTIGDERIL